MSFVGLYFKENTFLKNPFGLIKNVVYLLR